jgi:drug/metabolite transporter (DMT)-like permease
MKQHAALDRTAIVILLLCCACWGLNQIAIKIANAGISPVLQAGLRSAGAALLLTGWCRLRRIPLWNRDGTLPWGIAAGLLFALEFLLVYWGLSYTTASRGVVFLYTSPFVVALGAHALVPDDRLSRIKLLGLCAAFVGLLLAFADSLRLPSRIELVGDAMCFAGAIAWGATTVLIKASPLARCRPEKTLFYQLAVSGIVLPVLAVNLFGEPFALVPAAPVLLALGYQIVLVAFISYATWFWLVAHYPASRLSAFSFLTPVFGVAFGGLLLHEAVTPLLVLAVALICAGIWLVNRPVRAA